MKIKNEHEKRKMIRKIDKWKWKITIENKKWLLKMKNDLMPWGKQYSMYYNTYEKCVILWSWQSELTLYHAINLLWIAKRNFVLWQLHSVRVIHLFLPRNLLMPILRVLVSFSKRHHSLMDFHIMFQLLYGWRNLLLCRSCLYFVMLYL